MFSNVTMLLRSGKPLLTQAPDHRSCDRPLWSAGGQLVGLEECGWRAPGPVHRQSLCRGQQLPQTPFQRQLHQRLRPAWYWLWWELTLGQPPSTLSLAHWHAVYTHAQTYLFSWTHTAHRQIFVCWVLAVSRSSRCCAVCPVGACLKPLVHTDTLGSYVKQIMMEWNIFTLKWFIRYNLKRNFYLRSIQPLLY